MEERTLAAIITEMDSLKSELDSLRPLDDDRLNRLQQKFRLDWNYHSNSMEGNTLSMSETKSFIMWGVTAKGKPFRDYVEMKGHNDALKKLYSIIRKDLKITENLIKDFHKLILVEPYADDVAEINPGEWKTINNYLYSPTLERIDFLPWEEVPKAMNTLINWLNNQLNPPKRKKGKYDLHPLLIATGFHAQFIKIHPFGDGNGRMARIITNLIFMLCGYVPAIIHKDNKDVYSQAINQSSIENPEQLAIIFGESVIESLKMAIKAAKGEEIEEKEDFDKELKLLELKLKGKEKDVPIKTTANIDKWVFENGYDFIRNLITELSKFDSLFFEAKKEMWINGSRNIPYLEGNLPKYITEKTGIHTHSMKFQYSLIDLQLAEVEMSIIIELLFEFERSVILVFDKITNKKTNFRYNQAISNEFQKQRIDEIKTAILTMIKEKTQNS
jgi:Fic family protein